MRFTPTIPPTPIQVIILLLFCIPGSIANEVSSPPTNPPTCAIMSIFDPNEKRSEKTIIIPIIQVKVERTGPNLSSATQLMMR